VHGRFDDDDDDDKSDKSDNDNTTGVRACLRVFERATMSENVNVLRK
jgi:hypothetical protein